MLSDCLQSRRVGPRPWRRQGSLLQAEVGRAFVNAGFEVELVFPQLLTASLASSSPILIVHWPFRTGLRQDSGVTLLSGYTSEDACPPRLTAPKTPAKLGHKTSTLGLPSRSHAGRRAAVLWGSGQNTWGAWQQVAAREIQRVWWAPLLSWL